MKKLFTVLFLFLIVFLETSYPQSAKQTDGSSINTEFTSSITFQNVDGGYNGTLDNYLKEEYPTDNFGNDIVISWDQDNPHKVGLLDLQI